MLDKEDLKLRRTISFGIIDSISYPYVGVIWDNEKNDLYVTLKRKSYRFVSGSDLIKFSTFFIGRFFLAQPIRPKSHLSCRRKMFNSVTFLSTCFIFLYNKF